MNNLGNDDYNHDDTHIRLARHRNFQMLRDVVTSYNANIRTNNQHMLEYNRNMREIISYMREINTNDTRYYEGRRRRPSREPPPPPPQHPPPSSGRTREQIMRNFEVSDYARGITNRYLSQDTPARRYLSQDTTARVVTPPLIHSLRNSTTTPSNNRNDNISRRMSRWMNNDTDWTNRESINQNSREQERIIIASTPSATDEERVAVRTFRTVPNNEITTSFHNASRNSISELYRLLMRDFDDMMGFNNFIETTTDSLRPGGLTDVELESGLMDASYNSLMHSNIDTRCPIGLDDFEEGESIKQIVECGHIFKPDHLLRWFTRHTKCPLCRCDLSSNAEQPQQDISLNFTTGADSMTADDVEREIDDITNRITRAMMDSVGQDIEVNVNASSQPEVNAETSPQPETNLRVLDEHDRWDDLVGTGTSDEEEGEDDESRIFSDHSSSSDSD